MTATGLAVQLRPPDGGGFLRADRAGQVPPQGQGVRFDDKKGKLAARAGDEPVAQVEQERFRRTRAGGEEGSLHDAARGTLDDHVRLRRRQEGGNVRPSVGRCRRRTQRHRHAIVRRTVTVQTPFETVDVEVRKPRRLVCDPRPLTGASASSSERANSLGEALHREPCRGWWLAES